MHIQGETVDDSEQWDYLPDFPNYLISNHGGVYNMDRGTTRRPFRNQRGMPSVTLYKNGDAYTLALSSLVAKAFVPKIEDRFDTAISLDGNRANCRADNLVWRPRAFAVAYHRQFNNAEFHSHSIPILEVETDERFRKIKEAAIKYGLIFSHLFIAIHESSRVWPTNQLFDWDR